jgi:hypothetical protein
MCDSFGSSPNAALRQKAESLAKLKAQRVDEIAEVSYPIIPMITRLLTS